MAEEIQLNLLLDGIICKEVYEGVNVEREIRYNPSKLSKGIIERIKKDKEFRASCKEKVSKLLPKVGYNDFEIIGIEPSSNTLKIRCVGYYKGCKQFPEVHLKTILIFYNGMGQDIRDPEVFAEIVERARLDLGEKNRKKKEKRLYHFATLFKRALNVGENSE